MKARIVGRFEATAKEISINYNGFNYLIVFGEHENGRYFAIINHGVCGELASYSDTFWNSESIGNAVGNYNVGEAIAEAIEIFSKV